jgi:cytoskeletal protein CcmA (bactofilin family)
MLNIFKKETQEAISNIDSLIRKGDNLFSDSLILLDEKLAGNLFCSEKIVVEQNGALSGNITSKYCIISGTINGDILSTEEMQVKSTAVIKGNLKSALIHIEPGAIINGCITIAEDNNAVADLARKIQKYVTDECLEAKMVAEIAGIKKQHTPDFIINNKPIAQPQKESRPALKAAIADKPEYTQANEDIIKSVEKTGAIKATESNNITIGVEADTAQSGTVKRAQVLSAAKPAPKTEQEESNSRWW